MSHKLVSGSSTKRRASRHFAINKSKWEDVEGEGSSDAVPTNTPPTTSPESVQATGPVTRLQDEGELQHTHISLTQSGNVSATHRPHRHNDVVDACCRFDHLLPTTSLPPVTPSPNESSPHAGPTPQEAPLPSLFPYEFSITRFDDDPTPNEPESNDSVAPGSNEIKKRVRPHPPPAAVQEEWIMNYRNDYLREMIWLEGRGSSAGEKVVCGCGAGKEAEYRCKTCIGAELLCQDCVVGTHRRDPFHFIERWNGRFFEDTTLKKLGLRIQLGHPSHSHCSVPKPAFNDDFVVLDSSGIHEVGLDFCDCEQKKDRHVQLLRYQLFPGTPSEPRSAVTFRALKFFQIMSFESKGSHEEFYRTLVRLTGNVNTKAARDRYHEFLVVVSLWRHLKMLKRAGRGHDEGGVDGTGLGDCAVRCPACPQPGINLPPEWEAACPKKSWLYRLFVAIDGNFRLKRRQVSSEERDPGLNAGWAYFVNDPLYKDHLGKHWNIGQERSTCVAHDAVDKADREARGLAASGVVAVICLRHEFRLPNGIGDLQKGERYLNVDFIVFSGIRWFKIREIVISYDIACQWHKRLIERLGLLPNNIQPSWISRIVFAIPKFHLPAHIEYCNRTFSFNLTKGVGRSDGEAPERGWSKTNAIAKSTTEMGPGNRRDTLDDHFADINWGIIKKLGGALLSKMMRALLGRERHSEILATLVESIPPEFVEKWTAEVEKWESSPAIEHNPFEVAVQGVSEKQIRLQLAQEAEKADKELQGMSIGDAGEDADIEDGEGTPMNRASAIHPSLFVAQGLQLEDDQRKLSVAVAALGNHPTAKQLATMAERSNTLRRRIASWIEVQKVYMPSADIERLQHQMNETAISGKAPTETYDIPLFLPSSLSSDACPSNIRDYEAKLREGQGYDALDDVRRYLRIRTYLYKRKDRYARGVAANTRANTAIKRAQAGIDQAFTKYRLAREALVRLQGETTGKNEVADSWRKDLLPLKRADVRGLSQGLDGESEGNRTISWIWLSRPTVVADDDDIENDVQLQDVIRLEFLKCRARAMRWTEEVELLDEEMRRTLEYFAWKWRWWMCRTRSTIGGTSGLGYEEGFTAYALSQAAVYEAMKKAIAVAEQTLDDDE